MSFWSDFGSGFKQGFTEIFTGFGLFGNGGSSGGGIAGTVLNASGIPQLIETALVLLIGVVLAFKLISLI